MQLRERDVTAQFWALWAGKRGAKVFFLGCVVVAGVFGAVTAKFSILFTQALPAVLALASGADHVVEGWGDFLSQLSLPTL
jgi:Protein of unknown function (DUF1304)